MSFSFADVRRKGARASRFAAVLLMLAGCTELERTNPLDPQNPNSVRPRLVLVEAYVNEATPYSGYAISALDSLAARAEVLHAVAVEHHLALNGFADPHALPESNTRYAAFVTADRGVPDVLFNGLAARVQGASSVATAWSRYQAALLATSGAAATFTIEADLSTSASGFAVEARVARLGREESENVAALALAWEELGATGRRRVVRWISAPVALGSLQAGEVKSLSFAATLTNLSRRERVGVAVFVEPFPNLNHEVLQVALAR